MTAPDRSITTYGYDTLNRLIGFVAILTTLLFLECKQPFYFTQDDNLAVNLAEILQGCRSLLRGLFPTWNPYQYMGSPNTTLGWYALTYPPTYLSYWSAKILFGNENKTLEVFAFFHLLLAYAAIYWALRREGCRPSIAMMGSSCCAVSGYALIFSRSWFQFSAVLLWMALLVICVQALARGSFGWKWILSYGLVMGVAFHAGHFQMWIYNVFFADLAIAILICFGAVDMRAIWATVSAHFIALTIAAPLLVPEIITTSGVLRRYPNSNGIVPGLIGLFVPASVKACSGPNGWGVIGQSNLIGEMYYSGTLFVVFTAILLISFLSSRWAKSTVPSNLWFFCALLAFLLALGDRAFAWNLMARLPGFSMFRYPFKFLAYVTLFTSLAGAVALERLMRHLRRPMRTEASLAVVLWIVLAYHSNLCTASFYAYTFKPYPKPDPTLSRLVSPAGGRSYPKILPLYWTATEWFPPTGFRSADPHFIESYTNQWPTLAGVFSVSGYNPLVSESPSVQNLSLRAKNDPERALYETGVQYVLQYRYPNVKTRPFRFVGARLVYETPTVLLQQLPKPRPMAFPVETPDAAMPIEFDGEGANINTAELVNGGPVVLNMLWRREYRATAGTNLLAITSDDWGRILVHVPPRTANIRVAFRPNWELGFMVSLTALLCGLATAWQSMRAIGNYAADHSCEKELVLAP